MSKIVTYWMRLSTLAITLLSFSLPAQSANMAFMNDTAGQYFNKQDWDLFAQNVQHALNTLPNKKAMTWQNPKTGSGGILMPLNSVKKNGTTCRDLQITNKAQYRTDQYVFMYCKYRTGWQIQQPSTQ